MNWSLRFVDTGYWLAIYNIRDTLHPRARTLAQRVRGPLLTTTAILFEVADGLASPQTRHLGSQYLRSIHDDPSVEVVPITPALFDRAIQLYLDRQDKGWGLTDCASFIVMQDRGITEALAYDQHFVQAGFRALMREG